MANPHLTLGPFKEGLTCYPRYLQLLGYWVWGLGSTEIFQCCTFLVVRVLGLGFRVYQDLPK